MALLHGGASITPNKLEVLASWLPSRRWFAGDASALEVVGTYRFDDPNGEVGMETHLLRAGDSTIYQVPLTYRPAPLDGADAFLLDTTEHTVLGRRWVYHASVDPVYLAVLADTIRTRGSQAELVRDFGNGRIEIAEPTVRVVGSGASSAGPFELDVPSVLGGPLDAPVGADGGTLTGTWGGLETPVLLAVARA
jgi:maltokinase-like protein